MRVFTITSLIIVTAMLAMPALANADGSNNLATGFYGHQRQGYFFYNEPKTHRKKKPPAPLPEKKLANPILPAKAKLTKKKAYVGPAPMSAAWLKINLPKYLNKALDDPTPDNVKAYLLLQRLSIDKSKRFGLVAEQVTVTDPNLDSATSRPLSSSGTTIAGELASRRSDEEMREIAQRMGLWVFYSDSGHCPYCKLTNMDIGAVQRLYGFQTIAVSMDGSQNPFSYVKKVRMDGGQAAKLDVVATPALFLVNPSKKGFVSIGQGTVLSMDELKSRIFLAALEKGWITKNQYRATLPENNIPALSAHGALHADSKGFVDPRAVIRALDGGSSQ